MRWAAGLAITAALLPSAAWAVEPVLSDADVTAIVEDAVRQAHDPTHGLQIAEYTLYQRNDPIRAAAGDGLIDAIVVGTPREQLLYKAYLDAFQGNPPDAETARAFADRVAGTVVFRVFAHGRSTAPEEQHFLDRFAPAKLTFASGRQLSSTDTGTFGPSQDFFVLTNGRHAIRWLGVVMYRFDLHGVPDFLEPGKLLFNDGVGHAYAYEVDLSKYR